MISIHYCPTSERNADYVRTKKLRGALFKKYRTTIMNVPPNELKSILRQKEYVGNIFMNHRKEGKSVRWADPRNFCEESEYLIKPRVVTSTNK